MRADNEDGMLDVRSAAALLRQHAPSHLLWHLSVLPRARRFETTEELLTHLGEASGSATAVPVPT